MSSILQRRDRHTECTCRACSTNRRGRTNEAPSRSRRSRGSPGAATKPYPQRCGEVTAAPCPRVCIVRRQTILQQALTRRKPFRLKLARRRVSGVRLTREVRASDSTGDVLRWVRLRRRSLRAPATCCPSVDEGPQRARHEGVPARTRRDPIVPSFSPPTACGPPDPSSRFPTCVPSLLSGARVPMSSDR